MLSTSYKISAPFFGYTMLSIALTSPAIISKVGNSSDSPYPICFHGKVPLKVRLKKALNLIRTNIADKFFANDRFAYLPNNEFYVWVNSFGAVFAILPDFEKYYLSPEEFEVTEWHP